MTLRKFQGTFEVLRELSSVSLEMLRCSGQLGMPLVGDTSLDGRVTAPSGLKKHLGKRANLFRWEKEADRGDRERGLSR